MTQGNTLGGVPSTSATEPSRPSPQPATEAPPGRAGTDGAGQPAGASRLPSLTGLRFVAALLVFFNHVGLPFPHTRLLADNDTAMDLFDVTRNAGSLGVTFFFVLSGFVLTWSARPRDTAPAFWRRRLVKIYPNYLVTWSLAMVLFAAAYTPTRTEVANLLMVHAWVPEFDVFNSVNTPSWSLACELLFYAAFPLLHRLFLRIDPARLKYWIAGTTAGIIATPWLTYLVMADTPYFPGGAETGAEATVHQYWFAYFFPPVRTLDFALGMLLALAVRRGRWWNPGMVWSGLLLAGSYVLCSWVPFLYSQRSVTIIPIVLLIAAAASADVTGRFSVFRTRVMITLGEISFAFYLLHFIVLAYGRKVLGQTLYDTETTVFLTTAMLALSVVASWLLYTLVERPITRRWSTARRRAG